MSYDIKYLRISEIGLSFALPLPETVRLFYFLFSYINLK